MTEWTVVTVIVGLVGLFLSVGTPIIKLNANIVRLQSTLDNLCKEFSESKESNAKSHERIFTKLDEHEDRITKLEYGRRKE